MKLKYIIFKPLRVLITVTVLLLLGSCKKFVTLNPPVTSTAAENVYLTDPTAIASVTSIYARMSNEVFGIGGSGYTLTSLQAGLSADELVLNTGSADIILTSYYRNKLTPLIVDGDSFWTVIYSQLYVINTAIEGLNSSTSLTPAVKNQLLGEVYFMRAFSYFYLVNLYGDVPLLTTTDYNVNSKKPRTGKDAVYQQMIQDLQQAQGLLADEYRDGTLLKKAAQRVRPNKFVATALLARVYLYTGNWAGAEQEATKILASTSISYGLESINNAFLKDTKETIWALQNVGAGNTSNTPEGRLFKIRAAGITGDNPVYLNSKLVESFDTTDKRLKEWIGKFTAGIDVFNYAFKYKIGDEDLPNTENSIVLRVAEQYLIRAEARAKQNKLVGANSAKSDIDAIRLRAGLSETTATSQAGLLNAIMVERRHELFTEWGHRWLDLKRTNTIDAVMTEAAPLKNTTWNTLYQLYPIPYTDVLRGVNLVQNPGYQ